ncbi:MAG: GNAT family N-acetyltransferase [Rariglobus sp.]
MSTPTPEPVQHDEVRHQFSITIDGENAHADYALEGNRMICTHTFVPPALRGRGLAEKVVRPMLEEARRRHLRVVPACSYVATFIARHREFADLVD